MDEPYIGTHLAGLFGLNVLGSKERAPNGRPVVVEQHKNRPNYFFSDKYEKGWKVFTRKFILNRIYYQFQDLTRKIIIKEPNGIIGADTIIECLPNSRIIIIFRDGRDILDSLLDARSEGGWLTETGPTIPINQRISFLKREAKLWVTRMEILKKLQKKHPTNLTMVLRYEDLRSNTVDELEKIYKFIEIDIDKNKIEEIVKNYSFDNLPSHQKGQGKPKRSASPGKWKENFNEEEQKVIEQIIGNTLKVLDYK